MIPVRDYMDNILIPQWKKGNYANTQKSAEKLLQRLSRTSTELAQLVQAIHRDTKKGASYQRSSGVYGVGAVAVCAGSVFVCNIRQWWLHAVVVLVLLLTPLTATIALAIPLQSWTSYGRTQQRCVKEIVKYCTQLDTARDER
ncbi:hypothetical protein OS493_004209 [Desmophyllum pertusum]|uniref:Uncharacterized protein n=1 Tax=Desmophyllum pertusum TaxID=174260 RepID=A0A9W9ZTP8_9CNID|nr:hypothetical protein OS493_004209 [Desmophyllum pertusum]